MSKNTIKINEIGETPKGQYALGAVKGRALARTLYQKKYQRPSERDKQGEKMNKAYFKAWNHRNDSNPKQKEEMVKSYRNGYDYGFEKGVKENYNKDMRINTIKLSENDLHNLIKETIKKCLNESIDYKAESFNILSELKECLGADQLCDRLASRLAGQIDYRGLYETLKEIYELECNYSDDM